jgi:hypothetical protein
MRRLLLPVLLAVLAACGNNPGVIDDVKQLRDKFGKRSGPAAPYGPPPIPLAALDQIGKPLLFAGVPREQVWSVFAQLQTRGPLVTWGSSDGATLTLRDGVVTASRGLGDDLTSAVVPSAAAIAAGQGTVRRVHYSYQGGDREVPMRYTCALSSAGTETLTVVGLQHRVRRVVEACEGEGPAFRNQYWFQDGGKLRQSKQWLGETVGYLELVVLSR